MPTNRKRKNMCGIRPAQDSIEAVNEMDRLTHIERLLIRAYRNWVTGMRLNDDYLWRQAWAELAHELGESCAKGILGGLQNLILGIGTHARRPVRLHPPCCSGVCPDEIAILTIIGACQRREHARSRIAAEWIVNCDGITSLLEGAVRIATALNQKEVFLPDRNKSAWEGSVTRRTECDDHPIAPAALGRP